MYLNNSKQIVVKIGSSLLIDENKNIRKKWLLDFAKDIEQLINWNKFNKKHFLLNYILPNEDIEDINLIKKNINDIEQYDFKEIISIKKNIHKNKMLVVDL